MRNDTISAIDSSGIIAIVRGVERDKLSATANALFEGGIKLMELAFNPIDECRTAETAESIAALCSEMDGRMHIGAGTVLSASQVKTAHDAGAEYIVSPNVSRAVIEETRRLGMVSIPGAFTPSEAQFAHECGADFIKLFPAVPAGEEYFRLITVPLAHIKLLAVGSITLTNFSSFLSSGARGAAIGGCLVDAQLIAKGDFDSLTRRARQFTNIFLSR